MKRAPQLLIANWKMHGTLTSIQTLLITLKTAYASSKMRLRLQHTNNITVVLPPAIFLPITAQLLQESAICWGGQTMANVAEGAYTGEISGAMLKEFGCQYVLLGHSERRKYYGETDADIKAKCELALHLGLTPIVCCGETFDQQAQNKTQSVIHQQLSALLSLGKSAFQSIVIAYEPIWAIGTGLSAAPQQVQEVHAYIRALIADKVDPTLAKTTCILYGGSVNAQNAEELFKLPDVNGGLVGGASLSALEFLKIHHSFSSS